MRSLHKIENLLFKDFQDFLVRSQHLSEKQIPFHGDFSFSRVRNPASQAISCNTSMRAAARRKIFEKELLKKIHASLQW
jgi:hypothetical protein